MRKLLVSLLILFNLVLAFRLYQVEQRLNVIDKNSRILSAGILSNWVAKQEEECKCDRILRLEQLGVRFNYEDPNWIYQQQ